MLQIESGSNYPDIEESQLPYAIERTLGSGGYGVVEQVRDLNTGKCYARKIFVVRRRNRDRMLEMFDNERAILQSVIQHDHMIQVFATYTTKDKLGLIMSPVADSGDLDNYMEELSHYRNESSPHKEQIEGMKRVLRQAFGCLAAGLDFIHEKHIRHKDIKPQNILVHRGRVLYADFGLSFDFSFSDHSTTEGPTSVTRKYAAPEVLAGQARNSSSDVFSLGCTFLEMFSALTEAVDLDHGEPFSAQVPRIHKELDKHDEWSRLRKIIQQMTHTKSKSRPTANHIRTWLSGSHRGYFCNSCERSTTPTTPEGTHKGSSFYTPWTWSQPHLEYYAYLMSADRQRVLDTLWSTPSFMEPHSISQPNHDSKSIYFNSHPQTEQLPSTQTHTSLTSTPNKHSTKNAETTKPIHTRELVGMRRFEPWKLIKNIFSRSAKSANVT